MLTYYMCIYFACIYNYAPCVCSSLGGQKRAPDLPGTEVTDSCTLWCWCWESNLGPLQSSQGVFLTIEPSVQPSDFKVFIEYSFIEKIPSISRSSRMNTPIFLALRRQRPALFTEWVLHHQGYTEKPSLNKKKKKLSYLFLTEWFFPFPPWLYIKYSLILGSEYRRFQLCWMRRL